MRIAVPDLISNSYFPVIAAVVLGVCEREGLNISLELISPLIDCITALREGRIDFVGASAHAPLLAFPEWEGARLLCAQSQGTYWFLVMRRDLAIARGDLAALKRRRIAAVPFVGAALRRLLLEAGIDPAREKIDITMPEAARKPGVNFGVAAAEALENGAVDGFFANGVGAEVAIARGIGGLVLDIRRGDGPTGAYRYTMPAVATTKRLIDAEPEACAAMIRAITKTHQLLKQDIELATVVGKKLFPPAEAALIARVVERDLSFYAECISEAAVTAMNQYSRDVGLLAGAPAYTDIVATEFAHLWKSS
jgi:NitT/TauT family transport system substrate-binding protein